MNQEQIEYYTLKGAISELDETRQTEVNRMVADIYAIVRQNAELGIVALAYVGIEMQVKGEV